MERTKWTDRKFAFNIPAGWMQNILERLRSTELRLRALVDGLPDDKISFKPNGKWSIKEHIGHLSDLEELHQSVKSLMPDQQLRDLTAQEAADLLEYLVSLKGRAGTGMR